MKSILSVVSQDKVGIIVKVSKILAEKNINILGVVQTIMEENFVMMSISTC